MQQRTTPWGATAGDWSLFAQTLGLSADLLPVVSNPQAPISPTSKVKALGKVPSMYNREREVVGIPQWTASRSTDRDIARWSRDSDLGICVQTRQVRAIDIDVDDEEFAARVGAVIELTLGVDLPMRWRGDAFKFLLALRMPGEFVKRVIRTAYGAIEFLANGQQFIAVGTHPKGARYEWARLNNEIPTITPAAFEEMWAALNEHFAIEPEQAGGVGRGLGKRPVVPRDADHVNDPVVSFLEATGWVRGWQRDGRVDVRCPWEGEHTTDTGSSSTTWFPAGVGGFMQGHFRCLHAHCEHRTDEEFLAEVGYIDESFEVVPAAEAGQVAAAGQEPAPMPVFQRKRNGEILPNSNNVLLAVARPDVCGFHIAYDAFTDQMMLAEPVADMHTAQWRRVEDVDNIRLRATLERRGFGTVGKETMRDAMLSVAAENRMDTAIEWLEHRVAKWDGVDRVGRFWSTYYGVEDTPYTRAVAAYTWTALAGRVLEPGCKVDMVPVLISGEGTGKTEGVAVLAPSDETFAQLRFDTKEDDLARRMRGALVGELAELRGLHTKDREAILDWITRRHEKWTPKFKEFDTQFPRRLLMIGTTNEEQFLDDTGAEDRRWLPLRVGNTDLQAVKRDRDQLWAQGREMFKAAGVLWQAARDLAREVRSEHRLHDPWVEPVWAWLRRDGMDDEQGAPRGLEPVRSIDVLVGALGIPLNRVSRAEEVRLARVLRALGYERKTARINGKPTATWQACNSLRGQLSAQKNAHSVEDLA